MLDVIDFKIRGVVYGLCIGDALAMPVHWYYNRQALFQEYGRVTDYLGPRNPHPDSILWRSSYAAHNSRGKILHDRHNAGDKKVFTITNSCKPARIH